MTAPKHPVKPAKRRKRVRPRLDAINHINAQAYDAAIIISASMVCKETGEEFPFHPEALKSARYVLDKVMPRLKAVEITGEVETKTTHVVEFR